MLYLDNRNSIVEALLSQPESATRLWVEAGHERTSSEIMDDARKAGVSVRVAAKEQFARRFQGVKSHVCLEMEEFSYADPDALLGQTSALVRPLFAPFDGIYDPQNLGNAIRTAACFGVDALFIPRDNACGVTETVINVARGGASHIRISRVTNVHRHIEALKKRNLFCFGLDERGRPHALRSGPDGPPLPGPRWGERAQKADAGKLRYAPQDTDSGPLPLPERGIRLRDCRL